METNDAVRQASGLIGAIAALLWVRDTWPRRICYLLAGVAASHYAAPSVAHWTGADEALAGFLVGLFSMAIAAKTFETIEALKPSVLIERVMRRLGL